MIQGFIGQFIEALAAVQTELLLFCLAFAVHYALFGDALPRKRKSASGDHHPKCEKMFSSASESGAASSARAGDRRRPLQGPAAPHQRSDHSGMLRSWKNLKKSNRVPAERLAQVVESMQCLHWDTVLILEEVCNYLAHNASLCDIVYVNRLLEQLARSLDTELVLGIAKFLPSLRLKADASTFEVLVQMRFAMRSLNEVLSLSHQMRAQGLSPTRRTSLVLLKTALQLGDLEEAVPRYREVMAGGDGSATTVSAAPRHLAAQLTELACCEHQVELVLTELEAHRMAMTSEILNTILSESARRRDTGLARRVEELCADHQVGKSSRTYSLLARCADANTERLSSLLDEMAASDIECAPDMVQAVLAACAPTNNTAPVDRLCRLLKFEHGGQASTIPALIRFYAEAGEPKKACQLYDVCPNVGGEDRRRSFLDARTEKVLVAAALQCGRRDLATVLLEASPADTAKYISMIRACTAKGNLDEAMTTFEALEASGVELTNSLWNTALDACVECRSLKRAEALMQRMQSAKVADVVSYNTLIKAHLWQEHFDRAHNLMAEMRRGGCSPNHVTYNELINALVRSEREQRHTQVWKVVDEMKQSGVQPNRITCSILLKSLKTKSSHSEVVRVMELTDTMEEPMDEVLLSSVLEAVVRVGKPALVAQRLEQLHGQSRIAVTGAHTFGSLIKAYGYAKNIAGAWQCWREMRSQHVKPTSITIGCMVEAVATNGDVDGAYELISNLLQDSSCRGQVNSVVFGSVIKGYSRTRCMDRVWAVFEEMLAGGIEPSITTYNAMMDACTRNGQMDRLPRLLAGMRQRRLEPNLITYSIMIKGFCSCGDMPAALSVLEDLHREMPGGKADDVVYNTLLDGCRQAGLVGEGERLFAEMQQHGLQPSNYTLTLMVKLLAQTRHLDRAFELVETAPQCCRLRPNAHVYSVLMQACLSMREPLWAAVAYERAARERQQLDGRTCQGLVRALLGAGHFVRAVGLLRAALSPSGTTASLGQALDDGLVGEVLSALLGKDELALAGSLLKDFRAARPKARLDPAVERQICRAFS